MAHAKMMFTSLAPVDQTVYTASSSPPSQSTIRRRRAGRREEFYSNVAWAFALLSVGLVIFFGWISLESNVASPPPPAPAPAPMVVISIAASSPSVGEVLNQTTTITAHVQTQVQFAGFGLGEQIYVLWSRESNGGCPARPHPPEQSSMLNANAQMNVSPSPGTYELCVERSDGSVKYMPTYKLVATAAPPSFPPAVPEWYPRQPPPPPGSPPSPHPPSPPKPPAKPPSPPQPPHPPGHPPSPPHVPPPPSNPSPTSPPPPSPPPFILTIVVAPTSATAIDSTHDSVVNAQTYVDNFEFQVVGLDAFPKTVDGIFWTPSSGADCNRLDTIPGALTGHLTAANHYIMNTGSNAGTWLACLAYADGTSKMLPAVQIKLTAQSPPPLPPFPPGKAPLPPSPSPPSPSPGPSPPPHPPSPPRPPPKPPSPPSPPSPPHMPPPPSPPPSKPPSPPPPTSPSIHIDVLTWPAHPDTDSDPLVIHLRADVETWLDFSPSPHEVQRYDYFYFVSSAIGRCHSAPHFPGSNAFLDENLRATVTLPAGQYFLCVHQGTEITYMPHIKAIVS